MILDPADDKRPREEDSLEEANDGKRSRSE
jgi:hypothetical protein